MSRDEWDQVAAILIAYIPKRTVWAFGSRATGVRLKKYSDLDPAVSGQLTSMQRSDIIDAFDESLLPFKVDVVELDSLREDFRRRIEPDFVPVHNARPATIEVSLPASEDVQDTAPIP